jgi:hypothetical protein
VRPQLLIPSFGRGLVLAVTNSFTGASGQMTVPISRPSSTAPGR